MSKSKFTPGRQEIILTALRKGNQLSTCAMAAGINASTLSNWIRKGEEGEEPYVEFAEQVNEAKALGIMEHIGVITDAGINGSWQASAWLLERSYPNMYAKKERVDVSTDDKLDISIKSIPSKYEMGEDEKKLLEED